MNGHARFLGSPWMIRPEAFRALCSTVVPDHAYAAAMAARQEDGPTSGSAAPYQTVGGTAVIPIYGPTYARSSYIADVMAFMFGGCCLESVDEALTGAVNDQAVKSILLDIDSPGGQVRGTEEMAANIRQAAMLKPTVAYVGNECCSAALWLASAAGEIVASPMAQMGSLGVVLIATDDSGMQEQMGVIEHAVVSEQSPDKWPDLSTPEGRAKLQPVVNALASAFISSVADYRGTTTEAVLRDFGKGGVLVGDAARKAGMVDKIASKEATLRKLSGANRARLATARPVGAQSSVSRPTQIRARLFTTGSRRA